MIVTVGSQLILAGTFEAEEFSVERLVMWISENRTDSRACWMNKVIRMRKLSPTAFLSTLNPLLIPPNPLIHNKFRI